MEARCSPTRSRRPQRPAGHQRASDASHFDFNFYLPLKMFVSCGDCRVLVVVCVGLRLLFRPGLVVQKEMRPFTWTLRVVSGCAACTKEPWPFTLARLRHRAASAEDGFGRGPLRQSGHPTPNPATHNLSTLCHVAACGRLRCPYGHRTGTVRTSARMDLHEHPRKYLSNIAEVSFKPP